MDVISSVPDEIIGHILSFLSTKEAVSTSLLSKRWRNLCAFSPNLHLDEFHYRNPNNSTSFIDFVDNIFAVSGNSPLKQFTLKHRQQSVDDATRVNSLICNVLTRGVLDLNLFIAGKSNYSLPLEFFTCKTIVNLKLGMGFGIGIVPESASLPALKTLFLDHVGFSSDVQALISACHVLEELTIRVDDCLHWKRTISCPTLQRLIITCQAFKACDPYRAKRVTFDTPNLSYLEYCDSVSNEYQAVNLDSLVEAKLTFESWTGNPQDLFNGLRSVKILELSDYQTSKDRNPSVYEAIAFIC
ncbi:PREDICTED: F-box protein At4g22280-like [Camelina sativa]|uniref:F-box protein At4g22280-like n=1 Tax=Camelina sativa TaxID=90675 RepID=A0ABM0SL86_CAMSA|nr:PREDICTED: F-box protein At4g22280-like [Camelina sativa]